MEIVFTVHALLRLSGMKALLCILQVWYCTLMAAFYSDHPLVEYEHKNGAFSTMKNAFATCLSDTALTAFVKYGRYAAVIAEANVNAQNHAFSSSMCVLVLYPVLLVAL